MKKIVVLFLVGLLVFFTQNIIINAGRGCCSHHGGQAYCSGGRWVCNDGTISPTCTCSGGASSGTSGSYRATTTRTTTKKIIYGCTNKNAVNYNAYATNSDGSCKFEKTETKNETIQYETETYGNLKNGNKKVIISGQNGEKEVIIKTITDELGNEVSSEVISETIIKEPVKQIIKYEPISTDESKDDGNSFITFIFLIIVFIAIKSYDNKHKDSNLIISLISKINSWVKYILYFIYFIFIIPIFIDILLILVHLLTKKRTK